MPLAGNAKMYEPKAYKGSIGKSRDLGRFQPYKRERDYVQTIWPDRYGYRPIHIDKFAKKWQDKTKKAQPKKSYVPERGKRHTENKTMDRPKRTQTAPKNPAKYQPTHEKRHVEQRTMNRPRAAPVPVAAAYVASTERRRVKNKTMDRPKKASVPVASSYVPTHERRQVNNKTTERPKRAIAMPPPVAAAFVPDTERRRTDNKTMDRPVKKPIAIAAAPLFIPTTERRHVEEKKMDRPARYKPPPTPPPLPLYTPYEKPVERYKPTTERRKVKDKTMVRPKSRVYESRRESPKVHDPLHENDKPRVTYVGSHPDPARGNKPVRIISPPSQTPPNYYHYRRSATPAHVLVPVYDPKADDIVYKRQNPHLMHRQQPTQEVFEDDDGPYYGHNPTYYQRQSTPLHDPMRERARSRSPFLYDSARTPPEAQHINTYRTAQEPSIFPPLTPVRAPNRDPAPDDPSGRRYVVPYPLIPVREYFGMPESHSLRSVGPLDYSFEHGKTPGYGGGVPGYKAVGSILNHRNEVYG